VRLENTKAFVRSFWNFKKAQTPATGKMSREREERSLTPVKESQQGLKTGINGPQRKKIGDS